MQTIERILGQFEAGRQAVFVSGRSLHDLHLDEQGLIRPLKQTLFRLARERHGMVPLVFNLATGAEFDFTGFTREQRQQSERDLNNAGVRIADTGENANYAPPHERALGLLRSIRNAVRRDAIPGVIFLFEFGEDLAPDSRQGSSEFTLQISEMIWLLANEFLLRRHKVFLVFTGVKERTDERVVSALRMTDLSQPGISEKLSFIRALRESELRKSASYESGLDDTVVANLSSNTPNKGLEEVYYASARTNQPITMPMLVEQKKADVVRLSGGTLSLLDVDRVQNVKLVGRTIARPMQLLALWAEQLKRGNPHMPMNIMLAGAPSSGKTDLALFVAHRSQTPAYQLLNPKGSFVGQTEQQVRIQFRVFKDLSPCVGFIDEITEAFQMERQGLNLDSGASAAVSAEMLSSLSDNSRAGKSLLLATTNCPWRIGSAMASRFVFIPVLSPIVEDYPAILCSIIETISGGVSWDQHDPILIEAAKLFHQKGVLPRVMRSLITGRLGIFGAQVTPALVLNAAKAACHQDERDRLGAEYADLYAIRVCVDRDFFPWFQWPQNEQPGDVQHPAKEFLPWSESPQTFPFPSHLKNIVSAADGSIDHQALNARLEELKPHVNV